MDNKITDNKKLGTILYFNYLNIFMFVVAYVLSTILPIFNVNVFEGIVFAMDILLAWTIWITYFLLLIDFISLIFAIKNDEEDLVKSLLLICMIIQPLITLLFGLKFI